MNDSRSTCLAIQSASSEAQVISAVRHYLTSLTAAEAALMPAGLAALGQSHVENLVESALELVHHEMLAVLEGEELKLVRDAVQVLATATTRLATLATHASTIPPEPARRSGMAA